MCVNDFFRGGGEIRRAADFGLRKLDEMSNLPVWTDRRTFCKYC